LVYSSWEPDEVDRARSLGIVPAATSYESILTDEFAEMLGHVFTLDQSLLNALVIDEGTPLTRKTVAVLISYVANERGKYYRYFLPDSDDIYEISEGTRFQTGFVIQTGLMKLHDDRFNEDAELSRDEAYRIILRLYEYLL